MREGLTWEPTPSNTLMTWQEADEYARNLGTGWRLPTVHELLELVDYSRKPVLCLPIPQGWRVLNAWTSQPVLGYVNHAWAVDLEDGQVFGHSKRLRARALCVKGSGS